MNAPFQKRNNDKIKCSYGKSQELGKMTEFDCARIQCQKKEVLLLLRISFMGGFRQMVQIKSQCFVYNTNRTSCGLEKLSLGYCLCFCSREVE